MLSLRLRAVLCRKKMLVSWPATTQLTAHRYLVSNWCQESPIGPVLPVMPSFNCLTVNNLRFRQFHGMVAAFGPALRGFSRTV
jgi:hypothetical protein